MPKENNQNSNSEKNVKQGSVFKNLWSYIDSYPYLMMLSMFFGVVGGVLQLAPHFIVYLIADDIINNNISTQHIYFLGIICLVLACISFSSAAASTYISHMIAANVQKQLRQKIANKLARVPLGFFANRNSHKFKTLVVDDVEMIEDGIAHLIPETTAAYTAPFIIFLVMIYMDWRMAIVSVMGLLGGFVVMGVFAAKSKDTTQKFYASIAKMTGLMAEIITILPLFKIFNQGDVAISRASNSFVEFSNIVTEWVDSGVKSTGWFMLLSSSALLFVVPFGLVFIYFDTLSVSTFTFFLLFSIGLNNITVIMLSLSRRLSRQANIHIKMNDIFKTPELAICPTVQPSGKYDIEFSDVSFSYEQDEILSGRIWVS